MSENATKVRRGPGRPPLADPRRKELLVAWSTAEKAVLDDLVSHLGTNASKLIRELVIEEAARKGRTVPRQLLARQMSLADAEMSEAA